MPVQISHFVKRRFLLLKLEGTRTLGRETQESISLWRQAADLARETERTHVLAEFHISGNLPLQQCIDILNQGGSSGMHPDLKLAVVVGEGFQLNMHLFRNYLHHMGYEVEIFQNRATAKRWLLNT
ncbi:hypothetical protein [Robiginitalea sediminis]|uniref:hypothetical protein n=1 Tax=Robiginitalea sediminis TaxID=1982593 RepID=UPI000B4AFEEA|nr:hypothetical protein [Robiginitalea sediminis]